MVMDMKELNKEPIAAPITGYLGKVRQLLMQGVGVDAKNKKLIEASHEGNLRKVRKLLAQGADVNASDPDRTGDTSLICAVDGFHLEIVDLLLANNADVNAKNSNGYTALCVVATKGSKALPIIKLLLKSGANIDLGPTLGNDGAGVTPLYLAAIQGSNAVIKCLIKNSASANGKLESDNTTMMHGAAAKGDQETVRLLYDIGVALDAPRNDGNTPLHIASIVGNLDAAKALIDLGASIENLGGDGVTPLWNSVSNGRGALVELLLARGACHTPKCTNLTPLHVAAMNGLDDILLMLIHAGASVDVKNDSHTPIEYALGKGHKNTVDILNAELHKQKIAANLAGKERYVTVWVTNGELHT